MVALKHKRAKKVYKNYKLFASWHLAFVISITNLQTGSRYHLQIIILIYARDSFSDPKPIPVRNYFNKKICAFFIFVQVQYLTVSKQKDNKDEHTFIQYIRTNSYKTKKGLKVGFAAGPSYWYLNLG